MEIENAKQKYRKNNMNNTLKSVTLHYLIIKSKLNINEKDVLTILKVKIYFDYKRHRKRKLLTDDVIDDLMDIRNEMQVFCFKNNYLGYRFPKIKKNKIGKLKIDIFIDKMITEYERIDYTLYI